MYHGSGTHRTGFQRNVQGCTIEAIITHTPGRIAQRLDLGMSSGVVGGDGTIPAKPDDRAIPDNERPDRHLAFGFSPRRQLQRLTHVLQIDGRACHSHSMVAGGLPEIS